MGWLPSKGRSYLEALGAGGELPHGGVGGVGRCIGGLYLGARRRQLALERVALLHSLRQAHTGRDSGASAI